MKSSGMLMIKINAPIKPIPFKRVMTQGKRRYNCRRYSNFKDELGYYALAAMKGREPLKGRIRLHADFFKRRKGLLTAQWGDVDNFLKAVMDALNGICYKDDGQVTQISGTKNYGEPHIIIELEELK